LVAIFDGYSINHATIRMDIAGRNLTKYVFEHVAEDGL